jgi:predicted nucleotide-binding protein
VILELGFFYGKLGWENVFVVHKTPDKVFPNFERPSDLDGVVFDSIEDRSWQRKLAERLSDAGFILR